MAQSPNGQPRVAILAPRMCVLGHDPCGGSEVMLWEDARLIESAGIPVQVYGRAAKQGAPVSLIPVRTAAPLISSLEYCLPFVLREKGSILISSNEPTMAGLAPGRSVVRFDWETPLPRYWKLPVWLPRFQRAKYLFLSESDREDFLKKHALIPRESTLAIPYFVDRQTFRPKPREARGPLRVGFAGQWVPRKGCATLLDAWRIVQKTCPEAELWFAGSDKIWKTDSIVPGAEEVAGQVRGAAGEGWLKIAGEFTRSEMPTFWNELDIAVVPSWEEPFGLVALEALACGVPVVASNTGGLKEIVTDGESGVLVPPKEAEALARTLVTLLTNETLRSRLAAGSVRRAGEYSAERRTDELVKLLRGRKETSKR
jgi:glycosyltransferase involved in cell wall biosynthesis